MEEQSNIMKVEQMNKMNWSHEKLHQECSLKIARIINIENWPVNFVKTF